MLPNNTRTIMGTYEERAKELERLFKERANDKDAPLNPEQPPSILLPIVHQLRACNIKDPFLFVDSDDGYIFLYISESLNQHGHSNRCVSILLDLENKQIEMTRDLFDNPLLGRRYTIDNWTNIPLDENDLNTIVNFLLETEF